MKKVIKILLILSLIMSVFSLPAHAAEQNFASDETIIRPMFSYINAMVHYFDISSNGKATCEALLSAFGGDSLKVVVKLEQYDPKTFSWKTLKTWSRTEYGDDSCGAGGSWYVMSGYLYRSVATGYVYVNGVVVEEHEMVEKEYYY